MPPTTAKRIKSGRRFNAPMVMMMVMVLSQGGC
jgi:hypothetical protein